jgi:hypothetical protein
MDAKWEEARALAKASLAEKQAAMMKVVNAAAQEKVDDLSEKYKATKKNAADKIKALHRELRQCCLEQQSLLSWYISTHTDAASCSALMYTSGICARL